MKIAQFLIFALFVAMMIMFAPQVLIAFLLVALFIFLFGVCLSIEIKRNG
jgi:hypothetical protein